MKDPTKMGRNPIRTISRTQVAAYCDYCGEDAADCGGQVCSICRESLLCGCRCIDRDCPEFPMHRAHGSCCLDERVEAVCGSCSGSGEGRTDGSSCGTCYGTGGKK